MSREAIKLSVAATGAGVFYSDTKVINSQASRVALVIEVGSGSACDVVLQGKIGTSAWTDTALSATGVNNQSGQVTPIGGDGTIFAVWSTYRLKVTASGVNTVNGYIAGLG